MKIRFLVCHLIAILLCVAPSIGATTLARLTIDQLARAADAVARVRCISAQSQWENGEIWTVMSFNVVETMKGALPPRITVRLPAGRVGHLNAAVDGTPRFRPTMRQSYFWSDIPPHSTQGPDSCALVNSRWPPGLREHSVSAAIRVQALKT